MSDCSICGLPIIFGRDETKRTGEERAHVLCFDIAVANLSAELGSFMREPGSGYVEVRPGIFAKEADYWNGRRANQ